MELANGVEGLVPVSSLMDDYYIFLDEKYALVGEHLGKVYRLADAVRIEVLGVKMEDREIDFILAGENQATKDYIKSRLEDNNSGSSTYDFSHKPHKNKKKSGKKLKKIVKSKGRRRRR